MWNIWHHLPCTHLQLHLKCVHATHGFRLLPLPWGVVASRSGHLRLCAPAKTRKSDLARPALKAGLTRSSHLHLRAIQNRAFKICLCVFSNQRSDGFGLSWPAEQRLNHGPLKGLLSSSHGQAGDVCSLHMDGRCHVAPPRLQGTGSLVKLHESAIQNGTRSGVGQTWRPRCAVGGGLGHLHAQLAGQRVGPSYMACAATMLRV